MVLQTPPFETSPRLMRLSDLQEIDSIVFRRFLKRSSFFLIHKESFEEVTRIIIISNLRKLEDF